MDRREHLIQLGLLSTGLILPYTCRRPSVASKSATQSKIDLFFKISLAEWSLHRSIRSGRIDHLDFAKTAKDLDIEAIEYVNQFFEDKAEDFSYLDEMNLRAYDNGVKQLLIMIDGEGDLANLDMNERKQSIQNHYKWVDAAKYLDCHSIRVNIYGIGSAEEVSLAAIEGLGALAEYAAKQNINVIVENHGSYSSNGKWLSNIMSQINMPNCGTLPDFGNFCIHRENGTLWGSTCIEEYDRYTGVDEMMPFAKAISAKSHEFDTEGYEINTDFSKMISILNNHNYNGYVGIEYEGDNDDEIKGIQMTKSLLERVSISIKK